MSKKGLLGATALVSTVIFSAPAFAQATAPAGTAAADTEETIVVTGSRIRRPNDDSPVPVTTVAPRDIFDSGRVTVGDVLNDLPQLRSTIGTQNSTSGIGVRGLNFLDLRGLGRSRTLTLINGRRQVSADIINGVFSGQGNSIDINTIPTDLIERVDIVTGGNSSIYGSDAIAGVVNFVMKDNFEGTQLRARSGISQYGDAGNQYVALTTGMNFDEGRGNIALSGEFSHQTDYYASGRPNLRQNDAFVITDTDTTPSFDATPDRTFYRDIRSTTLSLGGQLGIRFANTATAPCGVDAVGSSFTCASIFQPDGSLIAQTGQRVGLGPNGNFVGGNGTSSREGELVALSPDVKRYAFNLIGHYEMSPAFVPFVEAKYVKTVAFGSQSGPLFLQGQTLGDALASVTGFTDRSYVNGGTSVVNREGIRLDNPYLSAAARSTITQQLTAAINSGVNPNTGTAFGTTAAGLANQAASLAQVAAGTYRFSLRRNYTELGNRDERITRETQRYVLGVRGDFNDDWRYEVSAVYGEHKESNLIAGNIAAYQRFLLATDTVRNAAGQIVCRSQVDPRYGGVDKAGIPGQLAADIAACVPLNPFGEGNISQAARNYVTASSFASGKATQFVATAFVSGDLSQLFELPGGPIAFSLGGEYRREKLSYDVDPFTSRGYTFYNALAPFSAPAFAVKEAFAELSVPLIKDTFLLQELTLHGSGRVADYKGGAGTVYAYSGDVSWRPIRDLLLRGAYSRSVRAPYIGSLSAPATQNFTSVVDPCSARNLATGTSFRSANCTAAGRPATYDYAYTATLEIRSGGNPNLEAETSKSLTLGGVFEPRFIPGLSISSDFYDIKVDNVITSVGAQTILNLCYDSPTLNNPFCGLFQRASGTGPKGEENFRVIEGSLLQSSANFARLRAQGIDTNIAYNHRFDWGNLNVRGVWTHVTKRSSFVNPSNPDFVDVIKGELGDPTDAFNIATNLTIGKVTFGHTVRWLDKMYLNTFEDYNSVNGQPAQNIDYAPIKRYPTVTYNDISVTYELNDDFELTGGVSNVGNVKPPYGLTGVGAGSGIYDNRGRFFFAGATARF